MNSGEGYLITFTNSLAATNILVVGDNIGAATSVEKQCAVAHVLIPSIDGKYIYIATVVSKGQPYVICFIAMNYVTHMMVRIFVE